VAAGADRLGTSRAGELLGSGGESH